MTRICGKGLMSMQAALLIRLSPKHSAMIF